MQDAICAALERAARAPRSDAYEVELRVGVRTSAAGTRVRDATTPATAFSSNVNRHLFFASFAALCRRADEVSPRVDTTHSRYAAFPTLRMVQCGAQPLQWIDKQRVCVPRDFGLAARGHWFDVRLAVATERATSEPDAIREVRAIGSRIENKFENARTRIGVPSYVRTRTRRSLRFRVAPEWRLDFTVVRPSRLVQIDTGVAAPEFTYDFEAELLEIELEYDVAPRRAVSAAGAAQHACALLDELATALGTSMAHIKQRLLADRLAAEMAHAQAALTI